MFQLTPRSLEMGERELYEGEKKLSRGIVIGGAIGTGALKGV